MRPPKQERSEASLARLVAATDRLVRLRGFQDTSLSAICAAAGLTTGAFYARFSRKEDLAVPLWAHLETRIEAPIEGFAKALAEGPLDRALRGLIEEVVLLYAKHGTLLRELVGLAPRNPELAQAMRRANERHLEQLVHLVLESDAPISHNEPRLACTLAFVVVLNTLRELVLDQVLLENEGTIPPDVLSRELSLVFVRYVGA